MDRKSQTNLNKFFSVIPRTKNKDLEVVEAETAQNDNNVEITENLNESVNSRDVISPTESETEASSAEKCNEALLELPEMPYQDPSDLPSSQFHNKQRINFQAKWYHEYPWIHFQKSLDSVLCHVCTSAVVKKLFKPGFSVEPAFTSAGFKNWRKAKSRFDSHQSSNQHKDAIQSLYPKKTVDTALAASTLETFSKNKKALRLIISTLKFLGRQGLPIRGLEDDEGNFRELLKLRLEEYPDLKDWLSRSKSYTSHDIQNEILQIMAHDILRDLTRKVQSNGIFSLIVDETTDISTKEQVSITLRYVDDNLNVEEIFMGLYETTSTTGEALTGVILDALQRFNLSINCVRGQCYDGAANMKGKFKGVQNRILQLENKALYVHCYNHSLNLALQDVVRNVPQMRDVLQYINDVAVLFDRSMKRVELLKSFQEAAGKPSIRLKPLCQTRWCVRISSIKALLKNYAEVLSSLRILSETNEPCSTNAKGLLYQFQKAEVFLFTIIGREVFEPCEMLAKSLQTPSQTFNGARELARSIIQQLEKLSTDSQFEELWTEMEETSLKLDLEKIKPPRKRKLPKRFQESPAGENDEHIVSIKDQLLKVYKSIVDSLINEITQRFTQPSTEEIILLENILCDEKIDLSSAIYKSVLEKHEFDLTSIKCQKSMFHQQAASYLTVDTAVKAFASLHPDLQGLLPEIKRLLKLLLVYPSSTASAERSFSMLRRLKTYLRSTMTQNRLNHLAILHVYQEEVDMLSEDKILKEFVSKNSFRVSQFGSL